MECPDLQERLREQMLAANRKTAEQQAANLARINISMSQTVGPVNDIIERPAGALESLNPQGHE